MIRALTGIQMGPRQFELPPNMPVSDSAGRYGDAIFLAAGVDDIGMVGMEPREGADAELAEEFVLVEHLGQHAAELGFVQDRASMAAGDAGLERIVDRGRQLGPGLQEPLSTARRVPGTSAASRPRRPWPHRTAAGRPSTGL